MRHFLLGAEKVVMGVNGGNAGHRWHMVALPPWVTVTGNSGQRPVVGGQIKRGARSGGANSERDGKTGYVGGVAEWRTDPTRES